MTPRILALLHAEQRLIERMAKLEPQLDDGDPVRWTEYASLASALAAIDLRPEVIAPILTQSQLGERLGVSDRTIRRRVTRGELPAKRAAL